MRQIIRKELNKLVKVFTHPAFLSLSVIGTALLLASAGMLYHFEAGRNPSIRGFFDCIWWGVSTITTVGFGDITPITTGGRLIGIFLMYTGTVLFISFTGVLVSVWTKEEVQEEFEEEIQPLEKELALEEKEEERIERLLRDIQRRLDRLERKIRK